MARNKQRGPTAGQSDLLASKTVTIPPNTIPSPSGGKSAAFDFAHALSAGNQFALDQVDEMQRRAVVPPKPRGPDTPSLADQFIADTYKLPNIYGQGGAWKKRAEQCMMQYRADIRHAHRFELDDDFTRYATTVAAMPAEKLLARLQYATLPYDVTWIEFDLKTKIREMRRLHGLESKPFKYDEASDRLGLLLHRLNDTDAVCQVICEVADIRERLLTPSMLCYFFSVVEKDFTPNDGGPSGCTPMSVAYRARHDPDWAELMKVRGVTLSKASLWGYARAGDAGMLGSVRDLQNLALPTFLDRHGEMGFSRFHRVVQGGIDVRSHENKEVLVNLMAHEATEFAGMLRWVITVLSMLNEVPTLPSYRAPQGTIRIGLTQRRPLLDYHRLTLRLPKSDPVQYINRKFAQTNRKHRAHDVRQHWRTYLHENYCAMTDHDWTYDYDEGYRLCGKCMAFGRLIRQHVRGDPTLGWVEKSYTVKKDRHT